MAPHTENRRSLLLLAIGFVVSALLLDAQALVTWAQRLPVSPVRETALQVTAEIHAFAGMLGSLPIREMALAGIGREGAVPKIATADEPEETTVQAPTATETAVQNTSSNPEQTASGKVDSGIRRAVRHAIARQDSESTLNIALVGDSMMAVGLAPYLKRTLGKQDNVHLIAAFRSGTGLSRPEIFDWIAEYPKLVDGQPVNLALCAMGANDAQGFVENGKVQAFDTPGWDAIYRQRVLDLARLLTRDGTKVIWLTLPVMRSDTYSAKTARINRIVREVLADMDGVQVLEANSVLADEDGRFRAFIKDSKGKLVSLRQSDGIHVTDAGARLLADKLMPILSAMAPVTPSLLN
jgi:uncharacterized protein